MYHLSRDTEEDYENVGSTDIRLRQKTAKSKTEVPTNVHATSGLMCNKETLFYLTTRIRSSFRPSGVTAGFGPLAASLTCALRSICLSKGVVVNSRVLLTILKGDGNAILRLAVMHHVLQNTLLVASQFF